MTVMQPNQPYIVRALHLWILDHELTPYLEVDTTRPHVVVPEEWIKHNRVTLSLQDRFIRDLHIGNEWTLFKVMLHAHVFEVSFPTLAITSIYAHETGSGTQFNLDDYPEEAWPSLKPAAPSKKLAFSKKGAEKVISHTPKLTSSFAKKDESATTTKSTGSQRKSPFTVKFGKSKPNPDNGNDLA